MQRTSSDKVYITLHFKNDIWDRICVEESGVVHINDDSDEQRRTGYPAVEDTLANRNEIVHDHKHVLEYESEESEVKVLEECDFEDYVVVNVSPKRSPSSSLSFGDTTLTNESEISICVSDVDESGDHISSSVTCRENSDISLDTLKDDVLDILAAVIPYQKPLKLKMDGHLASVFMNEITASLIFRKSVTTNFKRLLCDKNLEHCLDSGPLWVKIKLVFPSRCIIDYSWNEKIHFQLREKQELENLMSWLSTLGGAFSALGDEITKCAYVAGRISAQQFHIALKLGDPSTVARCKLFLALSLLQLHYFKASRLIIEQQYSYAKSLPSSVRDMRLERMCHGIWTKLKYTRQQYRASRTLRKKGTLLQSLQVREQ